MKIKLDTNYYWGNIVLFQSMLPIFLARVSLQGSLNFASKKIIL